MSYLSSDNLNLHKVINLTYDPNSKSTCLEELVKYVIDISNSYPPPYNLFVSGGIDSQAMLYVWKLSGVPFTAIHASYGEFNSHDFRECEFFCQTHGIEVKIVDFDLIDFLEHRLPHYVKTYQCASPQLCTHMAFSELVEGTKIFSGNIAMDKLPGVDNTIFGLQRYATISGASMIPFFLLQNAQVILAAAKIRQAKFSANLTPYQMKCARYMAIGIPIVPQIDKQTGFEKVKDYYDLFPDRVTFKMKLQYSGFPSKRVFDQLFRNKYLLELNNHYTPAFILTENSNVISSKASKTN